MVGTIWSMAEPTVSTATGLAVSGGTPAGKTYVIDLAGAHTSTLPPATGSGALYRFFTKTTATSSHIIQVTTTDVMAGSLAVTTDAAGVVIPTAATSDTITMNGSTTGGLAGSMIVLQDVASGVWAVSGSLNSTGAEATPFSAAVS